MLITSPQTRQAEAAKSPKKSFGQLFLLQNPFHFPFTDVVLVNYTELHSKPLHTIIQFGDGHRDAKRSQDYFLLN